MWKKTLAITLGAAGLLGAAAPQLEPSAVLLENGPHKVTMLDFEAAMTRFPEDLRLTARANPETIITLIDSLFLNRVLAARALEAKVDQDPIVRQRLEHFRESFLAQKYLDYVESNVKIPNLEARASELYRAEPKKYTEAPTASVQHVLVSLRGRTADAAKARAEEARARLASGADFKDIVKQYTEDPSARINNGELGWLREIDLEPSLGAAAFKLPIGTWSEPIQTQAGFHLLRVTERKAGRLVPFAEVKESIIAEETKRLKQRAVDNEVNRIRTDQQNISYPDRVRALKSDIDPRKIDSAARDAIERFKNQR